MNSENDSKVQTEEHAFLFKKDTSSVKKANDEVKTSDLKSNETQDDSFSKKNAHLVECTTIPNSPDLEVRIWRSRKIRINKSLIPLRCAQFLYFASGSLSSPFFSLMLTHRGLKLAEVASIFAMIFPLQLAVAYICGIVTDKIGNAKPVLLFLMLGVITAVLGLLLSSDVNNNSCSESDVNTTCFNVFNYTSDLEACKRACPTNNTSFMFETEDDDNTGGRNGSSNGTDVLNHKEIIDDVSYSNNTVMICSGICSCLARSTVNCTFASQVGLKIFYSVLILTFYSLYSNTYRFIDFACLNVAKQQNSDFGNERLYGILGQLVVTFICTFVLHIDKSGTRQYYDNVFWFALVLLALAAISAFNIREVILPPGIQLTRKTLKMFTNVEIVAVIFIAFVAGTAHTFNRFYHIWFLDSLNASQITIGIHMMTFCLYGLPIYITSKWWLRKIGRTKIMIIGLLCHAINGVSYSFLTYPWLSIVIEITKASSFHLYWIANVIHCNKIAPKGFGATVNAVVGTVHSGIGRSFGVPVGGYFISTYGPRTGYRILAGFCLVAAVLYSLFVYFRRLFSTKTNETPGTDTKEMKRMRETEA